MGISHSIGKIIGAKYEIPHGITSCLTLPLAVHYYAKYYPREMAKVGSAITGKDEEPESATFLVQELLDTLGLKMTIKDYGLGEKDIPYVISKLKSKEPWHEEFVRDLLTRN
jgi:Alcohol dehydrogenase, class IV